MKGCEPGMGTMGDPHEVRRADASLLQRRMAEKACDHAEALQVDHSARSVDFKGEGIVWDAVSIPLKEIGTRYETMIAIAVNIRSRRLDARFCEDVLRSWIASQGRGLYEASDADIRKIVRWAYRDRFQATARQWDDFFITSDDMIRLFRRRGFIERKLYFLLFALERTNRRMRQKEMPGVLNVSRRGMEINLETLKKKGEVVVHSKAKKTERGYICRQTNLYEVIPSDVDEAEIQAMPAQRHLVQCPFDATIERFEAVYFQTIYVLFGTDGMRRRMAAKEYTAFIAVVAEMEGGPTLVRPAPQDGFEYTKEA